VNGLASRLQQNGRHERMHLTPKKEATRPAARNFLQQQRKFDRFVDCCNHERRHHDLNMQYPVELYKPSPRPYHGLGELEYPFTTEPSPSPAAVGSASVVERST
jgi:hypothetical protein